MCLTAESLEVLNARFCNIVLQGKKQLELNPFQFVNWQRNARNEKKISCGLTRSQ